MATIRQVRALGMLSKERKQTTYLAKEFSDLLSKDTDLIARICDLLAAYSRNDTDTWRLVWLLYLCKDIGEIDDPRLQTRYTDQLAIIQRQQKLPEISRLWAAPMPDYPRMPAERVETLHTLDYLDCGRNAWRA